MIGVRGPRDTTHFEDYVIQLTLTLKMTNAQVVLETSVTVNNNSLIQDYAHQDDQTQPSFEVTPGFKPLTVLLHEELRRTEQY